MKRILLLGPGPAVIGEGGELDAAIACASTELRAAGHEVILVTSNPATVASDVSVADRTYLEPLDLEALRSIVLSERPLGVFPLFGGAKAQALALALDDEGALHEAKSELFGISAAALRAAAIGAVTAPALRSALASEPAWSAFEVVCALDATGAFLPICTIESLDAAQVHPGDAVCVTPPLDHPATHMSELHEAARSALVTLGLTAGIATCELALRRNDGDVRLLSITPGFTRSSALAAQVTGYPVAKVAIALALGQQLASLRVPEPASRNVVVRWPRFAFETFPDADSALGAQRKSFGESLGVGHTLADALRSAARGVDDGLARARPGKRVTAHEQSKRILVLGAGPSRIGQGPELATCASEACHAVRELGYVPVFIDSSVDSLAVVALAADHVHAEPVTLERVLAIHDREGAAGVIVQVGGDTALRLAADLADRGVRVLGTEPALLAKAQDAAPRGAHALHDAITLDVDAVCDGQRAVIAGVMEHLEPGYVHGGDAAALLPASTVHPDIVARIEDRVRAIALDSGIVGLLGVRVAVTGHEITVLEVEPRAGRTTAFVTRATGIPLVRIATKLMLGATLDSLGVSERPLPRHVAARERVFPFDRLGVDPALGREMRSTGEVIGLDDSPARAYGKALRGMGVSLRAPGPDAAGARAVLLSISDGDRAAAVDLAKRFRAIGFEVSALGSVRAALAAARVPFTDVGGDDIDLALDAIRGGDVAFAVVTARDDDEIARTRGLRAATMAARITCFTTVRLAQLACSALEEDPTPRVRSLQDWYAADV
ncbi:MAG: Carbamoyl-phosphate synthase large chain [Labilithrix sp.]|nr:Carbamoyl-phosphate synthase large chain [Labilithrix sp.]